MEPLKTLLCDLRAPLDHSSETIVIVCHLIEKTCSSHYITYLYKTDIRITLIHCLYIRRQQAQTSLQESKK